MPDCGESTAAPAMPPVRMAAYASGLPSGCVSAVGRCTPTHLDGCVFQKFLKRSRSATYRQIIGHMFIAGGAGGSLSGVAPVAGK